MQSLLLKVLRCGKNDKFRRNQRDYIYIIKFNLNIWDCKIFLFKIITNKVLRVVWLVQLFFTKVASVFKTAQVRVSAATTVKQVQPLQAWMASLTVMVLVCGLVLVPWHTRTVVVPAAKRVFKLKIPDK